MGVKLGRRPVPSSADLLRAEAQRFLTAKGITGTVVRRVEDEGPGISWFLFTTATGKARYAVVAGDGPDTWKLLSEGSGWPVV